jgi:O-antigen ligase
MVKIISSPYARQLWFYLLVATAASIPFSIVLHRNLMFALATTTVAVCDWRMLKHNIVVNKRVLIAGFIGLLNLLGLVYTSNIAEGFALLERSAITVALPVMIVMVGPSKEEVDRVVYFFTIACLVACSYCLVFSLWRIYQDGGLVNQEKISDRTYFYFINNELTESALKISPIYLGLYVNLCIGYLMVKVFIQKDRGKGAIPFLVMLHFFQAIIFALSAVLALLAIWLLIIIWLALHLPARKRITLVGLFVGLFIASAFGVYKIKPLRDRIVVSLEYDFTAPHVSSWTGITLRLAVWQCAFEAVQETPLFGHGTGDVDEILLKTYKNRKFALAEMKNMNAHNQYLHSYLMHGILGIAVLLAILGFPIHSAIVEKNYLLFIFIMLFALGFLTEGLLLVQKGLVFFSIFYPLLYFPGVQKK